MRAAWINTLIEIARRDDSIHLLVGDVGYSLVEPFAQEFPDRFTNIGIAEQNMVGISTGLALSGKSVFCYSLANFPVVRCLEQIRNDICYHKASVVIVTSGGGLAYGSLGVTHQVTEDLAMTRVLPNITVIAPGDPVEAGLATRALAEKRAPGYLRLVRTGDPVVHKTPPDFQIGRSIRLIDGHDVTLISTGGILNNTIQAAERLVRQGIGARVLSMHTIKPLDRDAVISAATETEAIITIEEHNIIGGLGGAVAETLAEYNTSHTVLMRLGILDEFSTRIGNQDYLREAYSLSVEGIVSSTIELLKK